MGSTKLRAMNGKGRGEIIKTLGQDTSKNEAWALRIKGHLSSHSKAAPAAPACDKLVGAQRR